MRRLHILMPMGGLGSRFAKAGWNVPKPLIPVDGMPMFKKAFSSFDAFTGAKCLTAIIRQELDRDFSLAQKIRDLSGAEVVVIPELTRGAVETCMAAIPHIRPDDGIVVLDCDLWFNSAAYIARVTAALDNTHPLDGVLLTFQSDRPRYSFAAVENGLVTRTAEKQVISNNAIAGAYFFGTGARFTEAARQLLNAPPAGEYYTSALYNVILGKGGHVEAAAIERYASFGTPEELALYETGACP